MQRLLPGRLAPIISFSHRPFRHTPVSRYQSRANSSMTYTGQDADWNRVFKSSVPPYNVFTKPIQKSEQDDRDYRIIKLENGLEAMLIHDPKADKAAASLNVAVGHLYDPDDMPGLAHFCEHLLFMGTERFPRENEYSEYLAKNNGGSNAYTGTSNTNYYFSVSTDALPGALSRFAGFFHCPLFAPSCTSRELNAVDSEHKKNHQSDIWRAFQLNKHLSKDGHPWRKFGSGNRDSLSKVGRELRAKTIITTMKTPNGNLATTPIPSRQPSPALSASSASSESDGDGGVVGRETRRRLVEWWENNYCANRMRLCVIGKESLDDLSDTVSNLFSPIPNRGLDPLPMINDHPFGPNEVGTLVSLQTVMSFHVLEVSFPLGYQPPHWRYKPGNFIGHLVGHEGPGSLHSYLKNKGWITALTCGPQPLARGFAMFKVTLHLTQQGFDNHRAASLAVFKYLSLLRSSTFPAWHQREISTIQRIRFRFAEKRKPDDYAVWIAEHMSWPVPRELVLSAPQVSEEWDERDPEGGEKKVREILDELRVDKGRAVLMARAEEHERIGAIGVEWEKEPVYGTPYRVEKFDEQFVKEAQGPNDIAELFLPRPNEFIPTNLDVEKREVDKPLERPHLIRETPLGSLWHKKDDRFWVPRAQVILEMRSPIANKTPRASVMTRLFAELVTDSLTEFSYDADLAGLQYSFSAHNLGVYITLSGYNDKLHVLAKDVLESAKKLTVKPERLQIMKEQVKRDWENFFLGQPFRLSDYYARYLMSEDHWTVAEKLPEILSITPEEVQSHISSLLAQVNYRMLVVGNMYKDDAVRLAEMTEQIMEPSPLTTEVVDKSLIPDQGINHIWSTDVPNPRDANSALTYYVHFGSMLEPRLRVVATLLTQILTEPAFNVLRTREQLGYIVGCSSWASVGEGELGLRIIVQSERSPVYLEERVEAFLDEMKEKIEALSAEEFEEQKSGLERRWREAVKNMSEETTRYWTHIDSGYLDFLRRANDANLLQSVTKEEVFALFLSHVHSSSPTRSKLSVHMRSQKPRPKKIGVRAMEAFEEMVTQRGIAVDSKKWREELTGDNEPLLDQFVAYWKRTLTEEGLNVPEDTAQDLLAAIPSLVEKYPAESEYEGKVRDGVVFIKDLKEYRASLRVGEAPRPVTEWATLPISKSVLPTSKF